MSNDYYDFYLRTPQVSTAPPVSTPTKPPVSTPPPVVTPPKVGPARPTAGAIPESYVSFANKGTWASGSNACKTYITSALQAIGLPVTNEWINGFLTIASRESAYNAPQYQVNLTDSNAVGPVQSDGAPYQSSRGVAQCIPQTFAAFHAAGTSTQIYDPVANFAAAINYVRGDYGVADDGSDLASRVQQADPTRSPKGY